MEAVRWQLGRSVCRTWATLRARASPPALRTKSTAPWSRRSAASPTWSMTWRWRWTCCAGWWSPTGRSTQTPSAARTTPPWLCSPWKRRSPDDGRSANAVKSLCSFCCLLCFWWRPPCLSALYFSLERNLKTLIFVSVKPQQCSVIM